MKLVEFTEVVLASRLLNDFDAYLNIIENDCDNSFWFVQKKKLQYYVT